MSKHTILMTIFVLLSSVLVSATCLSQEIEEGYITAPDGVRLFYKVVGKGPSTLVVLHGGPGNTMESILPDLKPLEKNHRIIYYDQRGNGRSDLLDNAEDLAINRHIEDLEAVRNYFNISRMTLLGNSWGGLLISYYAVRYPEHVEKLILHCAAPPSYSLMRSFAPLIISRIPAADRQRFRMISNPASWLTGPKPKKICREFYDILVPVYFANPDNAPKMNGDVCSGSIEAVRRQPSVNKIIWQSLGEWDILPKLSVVKTPALVIHGEKDMIPVASSLDWTMAFPNARMLTIKNAGHMSHVEQPEIFFSAVETFLQGKWPAQAIDVKNNNDQLNESTSTPATEKIPKTDEEPQIPNLPLT